MNRAQTPLQLLDYSLLFLIVQSRGRWLHHWGLQGSEGLLEIRCDIVDVLETDGQPDVIFCHTGGEALGVGELLVSGRPGMND